MVSQNELNWTLNDWTGFVCSRNFQSWSLFILAKSNWIFPSLHSLPINRLLQTLSWRRQWWPTPVLLPGKSHGRRSLVGCSPWGREELNMTEWLHFHSSLSSIGEGHGNPLQCYCLENPRDGGAWWAAVYGVTRSRTQLKRLSSSSSSSQTLSRLQLATVYRSWTATLLLFWNKLVLLTILSFLILPFYLSQYSLASEIRSKGYNLWRMMTSKSRRVSELSPLYSSFPRVASDFKFDESPLLLIEFSNIMVLFGIYLNTLPFFGEYSLVSY